jgi:hypothetical protein
MLSDLPPIDLFSSVFFLRTAYEYLKLGLTYEKGFETDLLELLRLCLSYYRCSKIENIDLRYNKSELRKQLGDWFALSPFSDYSLFLDIEDVIIDSKYNKNSLSQNDYEKPKSIASEQYNYVQMFTL